MSKNINEKMLEEMINDNFLEISKEGQESINGGKIEGDARRAIALYSVRPWVPKIPPARALYSVSPRENFGDYRSLYSVQPFNFSKE